MLRSFSKNIVESFKFVGKSSENEAKVKQTAAAESVTTSSSPANDHITEDNSSTKATSPSMLKSFSKNIVGSFKLIGKASQKQEVVKNEAKIKPLSVDDEQIQ